MERVVRRHELGEEGLTRAGRERARLQAQDRAAQARRLGRARRSVVAEARVEQAVEAEAQGAAVVIGRDVGDADHHVEPRGGVRGQVAAGAVQVARERVARDADRGGPGYVVVEVDVGRRRVARVHGHAEEAPLPSRRHARHAQDRRGLDAGALAEESQARGVLLDVQNAAVGQEIEPHGRAQPRSERLDHDAIGNLLGARAIRDRCEEEGHEQRAACGHRLAPFLAAGSVSMRLHPTHARRNTAAP